MSFRDKIIGTIVVVFMILFFAAITYYEIAHPCTKHKYYPCQITECNLWYSNNTISPINSYNPVTTCISWTTKESVCEECVERD